MTSPPLTDQTPREDPTEGLRSLVADLRALTGRLELKERSPELQATLKAAQERVCGPRALVMLLSEHAELKRRFLERLLGPNLALVPNPTMACTRLEYGAQPEQTVTMLQERPVPAVDPLESFLSHASLSGATESMANVPDAAREPMQTIRLPNPTLKGGLAVIDTPAMESGEPSASVLECVEQADAWIFVLDADHALSEASQALLRRLPERGARLEMIVENAEALSGEERMAARDRLMQTLREQCNIEAPRLTLVASAATEGDEGSFWHGRFTTFHSVMMLRGRERWLEGTRAMVLDALSKVGAEIDLELKSIGPGLRHSRLRLGRKDLDGLRTRFSELGGPKNVPAPEVPTVHPQPAEVVPQQSRLDWSGGRDPAIPAEAVASQSPLELLAEAIAAIAPEDGDSENASTETAKPIAAAEAASPSVTLVGAQGILSESPAAIGAPAPASIAQPVVQPAARAESTAVRLNKPTDKRPKRGLSVHLTGSLKQLMPHHGTTEPGKLTLLKRIAWVALVIVFICLILWALAPRGFLFGQETPAQWDFQQPTPALASRTVPAAPSEPPADPPQPGNANSLPGTTYTAAPNIPSAPLAKHHGAIRTPLVHPIPSDATAGVSQPAKRHHRRLLGLGKLWHWVRHPHHARSNQDIQ